MRLIIVLVAATAVSPVFTEELRPIFTDDEVKHCKGQFGGPGFVTGGGWLHVLTTCAKRVAPVYNTAGTVDDIMGEATCVIKSSSDHGVSWGGLRTISPPNTTGYASCKGLYDVNRHRLVVQYDYVPSGDSSKTAGKSFYQIISSDNGSSWSEPQNLTDALAGCDHHGDKPRMMAGNRIQTSSGRLLWGGESDGNPCFWFSDDGGETYKTQMANNLGKPNEFSLVQTSDGRILMNSRKGNGCSEENHRREYSSEDEGLTWSGPTCSPLLDAVNKHGHGCEASIINSQGNLFFLNPGGDKDAPRTHMQVHCSLDGGKSWPANYSVSSTTKDGGYSDLIFLPNKTKNKLLLGFQNDGNSNILTVHIDTSWCQP